VRHRNRTACVPSREKGGKAWLRRSAGHFLWSGCGGQSCGIAAISSDSRRNAAEFLCNPDYVAEREGFSLAIFRILRQRKEITIKPSSGSTCVLSTAQTFSTAPTLNIHTSPSRGMDGMDACFPSRAPIGIPGANLCSTMSKCHCFQWTTPEPQKHPPFG